jgi:hypothetical protein
LSNVVSAIYEISLCFECCVNGFSETGSPVSPHNVEESGANGRVQSKTLLRLVPEETLPVARSGVKRRIFLDR